MRPICLICLLCALSTSALEVDLPGRGPVRLELERFRLLTPEARFVAVDGKGEHDVEPPAMQFFRGRVAGEPNSSATLSLRDGAYRGTIRIDGESFVLGEGGPRRSTALEISCNDRGLDIRERPPLAAARGIDGDTILVAPIAIDATVDWFNRFPSLEDAQAYLLNTMAVASTFMSEQVNVRLEVPYLRVFTAEPDPYTDQSQSTVQLLDEMTAEWNANQTHVARAAAHLFSWRQFSAAGRAYIDRVCDHVDSPGSSLDYGVTTIPIISSPFESYLVSHELAHNFGSPHTQCYLPPIDTCATEAGCYQGATTQIVGTLMSNCQQFDPVFHPRVKDERLRPGAEAAFGICLSAADAPGRTGTLSVDAARTLVWDPPCNDLDVPGQDFAVYRGTLGAFGVYTAATCSTSGQRQWAIPASGADEFFLVVPTTSTDEGSYGRDGEGNERGVSGAACKPQSVAYCP